MRAVSGSIFPIVLVLVFSTGCGALWSHEKARTPVAPTAADSDLVFVRTGDRAYYYIVDTRRKLCFFHSTLYGKKHMVELPCHKLPEYEQVMAEAGVPVGPSEKVAPQTAQVDPPVYDPRARQRARKAPVRTRAPRPAPAPEPADPYADRAKDARKGEPVDDSHGPDTHTHEGDHQGPVRLTNEDRNAFRRAWVQRFCARRAGQDEPLETLLARHRLDQDRWDAAKAEFSADRDLWSALTAEAMDTCP